MKDASASVLVVDDEPLVCNVIADGLGERNFECLAVTDPQEAKELLDCRQFDVLVTDISMPKTSGLDLLAYTRQHWPECKVVVITGVSDTQHLAEAINLGAYAYFEKPFKITQLVESVSEAATSDLTSPLLFIQTNHAKELASSFERISLESIRALIRAVEAKDPYTRKHSEQVSHYATELARHVGRSERNVETIRVAALLHDIGKIGVPDNILTKPGCLTEEEFEMVRRHPLLGSQIIESISAFTTEAFLVRHHHENWNGSGYPDGLAREEIPFDARILNIADSMDAMLMKRTYKNTYSGERMLEELALCAGSQFDPQLVTKVIEWAHANQDKLILPVHVA